VKNVVVLRGGMGSKQRLVMLEHLAEIAPAEERILLATGRYIGEGFDDTRLDTLFLALLVSWKGTLVQYAGRLHRLHAGKTDVRTYDANSSLFYLLKHALWRPALRALPVIWQFLEWSAGRNPPVRIAILWDVGVVAGDASPLGRLHALLASLLTKLGERVPGPGIHSLPEAVPATERGHGLFDHFQIQYIAQSHPISHLAHNLQGKLWASLDHL